MIIRKIKPEELKRTNELFSVAFEFPDDNSKSATEVYEDVINNQTSRDNIYWQERYAAFEDDDKTMMSFFVAKPYPVHFDGNHCKMTGIGGVATLPQYRRRGGIRRCFEKSLADMYENGYDFSYLYPFSTAFYRKFGYELCVEKALYKIKLSFIPQYNIDGYCELVEPNDLHMEDIKIIHKSWQEKYNMMVENEDCDYIWLTKSNPVKEQVFTYLYKDKNHIPKGYLCFKSEYPPEGRTLSCSRFVYTDVEGFKGLLNLARGFASDYMYISFSLPTDLYIAALLPEWSLGSGNYQRLIGGSGGMARVIHVQNVLQKARYKGDGEIHIAITDPYIKENTGTFHVIFAGGKATSVTKDDSFTADISLHITDFSRLIIGCLETEQIAFLENVTVNADMDILRKVFYKKPVMLTEYF